MTPQSPLVAGGEVPGHEGHHVVGHVELTASFPIYADNDFFAESVIDANEALDVLLDNIGLEGALSEALDHGSTALTVQYRGDEMTHRIPA